MNSETAAERLRHRAAPMELSPDAFRELGHRLVDRIAEFLRSLPDRPVNPAVSPDVIRGALGDIPLPQEGTDAGRLLDEATELLFTYSLFNGHPRFLGYITSSAAPIGALGDMLAAAVNPNLGGWLLAPIACEIERQTVRWIAELIGYPSDCGGILVSGGNMANFIGVWAARKKKLPWDVGTVGVRSARHGMPRLYASDETHVWIKKGTDLTGMGTDSVRLIPSDERLRMDVTALRKQIEADLAAGDVPFMVIANGGSVSTGAVDELPAIAEVCRDHDLWFHVDGAYGAPAAALPDAPSDLRGLSLADSVAVDPHKWLYAPIEAGCTLVRSYDVLKDTFAYRPPYYPKDDDHADTAPIMYYAHGPQNSKGFRALKVWLGMRQVGREGYVRMMSDDIELARTLHEIVKDHTDLEAHTHGLSVTTFRFVPPDLAGKGDAVEEYLSDLNRAILDRMQAEGEAFLSNAVIRGRFLLRACVVNFRTSLDDIEAVPRIVSRVGREVDASIRPRELK